MRDKISRRAYFLTLLAFPLLLAPTREQAAARPPLPWCAYLSGGWGVDCSYYTFEQCREFISGVGGYCGANPYVTFIEEPPGHGKRRPRARYR
jgi:hypothetical protein